MGVTLSPGGSGNRADAKPALPTSWNSQVPVISTTNPPDATNYPKCKSTTPAGDRGTAPMPTGGDNPISGGAV